MSRSPRQARRQAPRALETIDNRILGGVIGGRI